MVLGIAREGRADDKVPEWKEGAAQGPQCHWASSEGREPARSAPCTRRVPAAAESFVEKWFKNRSASSFPCDSALDLRGGRWKSDAGYEQRPEELQTSEIP